jgi:hypothetical protein
MTKERKKETSVVLCRNVDKCDKTECYHYIPHTRNTLFCESKNKDVPALCRVGCEVCPLKKTKRFC